MFQGIATKLLVAFYLLLGLSGLVQAQGILYQFSTEDGPKHYLLGTMHSGDKQVMSMVERVEPQLSAANQLVLELVPDTEAIMVSAKSMLMPKGKSLQDVLPAATWKKLEAQLKKQGVFQLEVMKWMKPWALAMTLSLPPEQQVFLDQAIYLNALERHQSVHGLESAAEQIAVFEELSMDDQIRMLEDALDQQDQLPSIYKELVEAYVARDLDALANLTKKYEQSSDSKLGAWFDEVLIKQRNQRMLDRLLPLLTQGSTFVAVGALHLVGGTGLMAGLKNQGYTISPIY